MSETESTRAAPVAPPVRASLAPWSAFFLVLTHFALLMFFFAPAITTPDANSYFAQARTLALDGSSGTRKESPVQYLGPHYRQGKDGLYYPAHAPGLGILMAVPYRLLGPSAAFWVNPLLCALSLAGLFLLGRLWVGQDWALFATALMALNPFFNEHAHFGDAHAAVCFLLVWSLLLLERLPRRPSVAMGLAAGLLAGMIPLTRYAEGVFLPALAAFALARRRQDRADRPALWAAAAGTALPLLWLGLRNDSAFGAFWRTGYSEGGLDQAFSLLYFGRNGPIFLQKLLGQGAGLSFALGVPAIALMRASGAARRRGRLLAWLCAPTTLLYACFFSPPDAQSMRYLLPTFPLYALATAWLLRRLARSGSFRVGSLSSALLALHAAWGLPQSALTMGMLQRQGLPLARALDMISERVPERSVLVGPGRLLQYLDVFGRWRLVPGWEVPGLERGPLETGESRGLPSMPGPPRPPFEDAPSMPEVPAPASLRRLRPRPRRARPGEKPLDGFSAELRRFAGPHRVFLVADGEALAGFKDLLPAGDALRVATRLPGAGPRAEAWLLAEWTHAR